jgi:hypothetical protein
MTPAICEVDLGYPFDPQRWPVSCSVNLKGWSLSASRKGHFCLYMGFCRIAVMTANQDDTGHRNREDRQDFHSSSYK